MEKPAILLFRRSCLLLICLAVFSGQAFAAVENVGILDNVLRRFSNVVTLWGTVVTQRATWLFWLLVAISMVWTFGMMALRKADIAEFFAEFARFTIFTGFYWWLLVNGPTFAVDIMNSLRRIAAEASGLPGTLEPSGIVDIGFTIFGQVVDRSSVWQPQDSIVGVIMSAIILVVFALIAVNMLLLLISGWILAYAGVFFLGFGGSRWTSDMAVGYFKTVLNVAAQLFAMVLLVGVGRSFVDQYYSAMSAAVTLKDLGVMLVVAAVLLVLVTKIPPLIGGLAGGNTGALGSGFGAGAAMAAAAIGAAAVSTAGAALAGGAAGIAGGAQALMAAFSKANASESGGGSTGMNRLMNAAEGAGSSDGGGGGGGGDSGGSGESALAAAMGDSGGETSSFSGSTRSSHEAGSLDSATSSSGTESGRESDLSTQMAGSDVKGGNSSDQGLAGNDASALGDAKPSSVKSTAGAMASKVGAVAAGTAVNLAQGAWDVAKAKMADMKGAAIDRIGETTGGKIATAIKARGADVKAGGESEHFDDNSLSASSKAVDSASEIAAFRDRKT